MDYDYNEATKVGRKRGEKNTHEAECLLITKVIKLHH